MSLVGIKGLNALIYNKPFFDQPVEKIEPYGLVLEISRNNDSTTRNLLITHITKIIINSMESIYPDNQIQAFLNELISLENYKNIMVQQCFFMA